MDSPKETENCDSNSIPLFHSGKLHTYIPMNFVEFTEFKESWHNPKMVGLPGVIPIWQ